MARLGREGSEPLAGDDPRTLEEILIEGWVRSTANPCLFARSFASSQSGVLRQVPIYKPGNLPAAINAALEDAALHREALLLLFPRVKTEQDIAELVNDLGSDEQWRSQLVDWPDYPYRKDVMVSLQWCPQDGPPTTAMGLGPLLSMPPTRRAPVVAIAIWPGREDNPYMQMKRGNKPARALSLADSRHGFDNDTHERLWMKTVAETHALLQGLPEDAASRFRQITFCLSPQARRHLTT